jgi:hypothetical protein
MNLTSYIDKFNLPPGYELINFRLESREKWSNTYVILAKKIWDNGTVQYATWGYNKVAECHWGHYFFDGVSAQDDFLKRGDANG